MTEQEKERREAFMKTYGVTEEEMDFFEYIDGSGAVREDQARLRLGKDQ